MVLQEVANDPGGPPVPYVDWVVGYTSLYICQNSSNYALQMCAFHYVYTSSEIFKKLGMKIIN